MTTPGPVADRVADLEQRLTGRLKAVETDLYFLTGQVRKAIQDAERAAGGMDDLEEAIDEIDQRAVAAAAAAMAEAMRQRQFVLDADATPAAVTVPGPEAEPADRPARPDPDVLHAWVDEHIAPLVRKTTTTGEGGGIRWCRQWWHHHDARERFVALYIVFAELSEQDTLSWLSAYLRDHLDPHLAILTSSSGPFHACTPTKHSEIVGPLGTANIHTSAELAGNSVFVAPTLVPGPGGTND